MRVILLKDIQKIGRKGETKEVGDGYALNFLIPKKLAAKEGSSDANRIKKELEEKAQHKFITGKLEEDTIKSLASKKIIINSKSNKEGHLFAQVRKENIIEGIKSAYGIELHEENVLLDEHLKTKGEHEIKISGKAKGFQVKMIVEIVD